ncbi:MAG TPA: hypothetical protein VM532_13315 [Burkholderiales bacterium]|nr:hypothetical protein [Burkholderiales bacterium]
MVEIEQLTLRLPAGFESRAGRIGRLTAEALSNVTAVTSMNIAQLSLPPQTIKANWSDRVVAQRLANAIGQAITQQQQTGGNQK